MRSCSRRAALRIGLALTLSSCSDGGSDASPVAAPTPAPTRPGPTEEDFAVWDALLAKVGSGESLLVSAVTLPVDPVFSGTPIRNESEVARADSCARNATSTQLEGRFAGTARVEVLPLQEEHKIFSGRRDKDFEFDELFRRHPGATGLYSLGLPGFDAARREALVFYVRDGPFPMWSLSSCRLTREGTRWHADEPVLLLCE